MNTPSPLEIVLYIIIGGLMVGYIIKTIYRWKHPKQKKVKNNQENENDKEKEEDEEE